MFGKILRLFFYLTLQVLFFIGLVWLLLGIDPMETYIRSRDNLGRLISEIDTYTHKIGKTGKAMKQEGNSQLQQASDRFHGKDPYEKINSQLSADIKK